MSDQAEEIRRRLEARGTKAMPDPLLDDRAPLPPSFQPASDQTDRTPIVEIARKRKLEAAIEDTSRAQPVVVVDVKIKFWSLVVLMVKVAFASIPATIIVSAVVWFVLTMLYANR